jgi:hypothetical protein
MVSRHPTPAIEDFSRRVHANGTADSICHHCFATVARVGNGQDMRLSEAAHRCWQSEGAGVRVRPAVN